MSLTQAMSIALSGLRSSQQLIAIASNNIANAQTVGYTSKTATTKSIDYNGQPGGSDVTGYTSSLDRALSDNYNASASQNAYYSTQNSYMSQVQSILDSSASPPELTDDIAQFSSAWSSFASSPESVTTQQTVISAGRKLAQEINSVASNLGSLRTQVQTDITTSVNTLNASLKKIATLNAEVQDAISSGKSTADLQDQINTQVNTISAYTNVTLQPRSNGQIALYTSTGQQLVDGGTAQTFSYSGGVITNALGTDVTGSLTGGSLQAALDFVSSSASALASTTQGVGVIGKLQAQLSTLCDAFTGSSGAITSSFATAFTAARTTSIAPTGTQSGATIPTSFFTVTNNASGVPDSSTFAVASSLLSGTSVLPQTGTAAIVASFSSTSAYSTSGLSLTSATYSQLGSSILSNMQQSANSIKASSTAAADLNSYYKTQISNTTGVNLDTELANLTMFQNSYAASAHVMSTINSMMQTLMSIIQ